VTPTPSRGTFAALAAGVVAFTIYGSLVPFHFVPRPLDDAVNAFLWVLEHRLWVQSRSDFAANFILGLPLGFCLLAAVRLDKPGDWTTGLLHAAFLWPWCVLFAATVEFSQLWFPQRTCSASDILAQGLGSGTGMWAWIVAGPPLVHWFRSVWASQRLGGTAGRLLVAYVALLMLASFLPLDLTLSPGDLNQKLKRGMVVLVPFSETGKLDVWLQVLGLYFPAGMLLAGVNRRAFATALLQVAAQGLVLAAVVEAGQIFVMSRSTSVTDIVLGGTGITLGWLATRLMMTRTTPGRGLSFEWAAVLAQGYIAYLLAMNWLPFDFDATIGAASLAKVNWVPFAAAYEKNYLTSLEEMVAKSLLFTPLGAIVIAKGVRRTVRRWRAVLLCVLACLLIEAGQLYLPGRVTGPTDVLFAAVGGWLGAQAALRLRAYGFSANAGTATQ
jgi:VanZ family protein